MAAALKVVDGGMDRQKALEAALAQIDRAFGKGSVMKLGSRETRKRFPWSGSTLRSVSAACRARVIEIYGPESSGKTTWRCTPIAEAQRGGGTAAFVDAEHARRSGLCQEAGRQYRRIDCLAHNGEQALEIVDTLVRSNAIDVLVIDSVAAWCAPKSKVRWDSHVGLQARLMSQSLRKLTGSISRSRCMVIFINQLRMKIGVMYGNPETTTGGNALKFYASVRLYPPHRPDQGSRRGGRQHHPRQGRQEQGGAAVQAGRIRHHVRRRHFQARRDFSIWASRRGLSINQAPGSAMIRYASARAARMPKKSEGTSRHGRAKIEKAIRAIRRGFRSADGRHRRR